jgi:hypothetical protein
MLALLEQGLDGTMSLIRMWMEGKPFKTYGCDVDAGKVRDDEEAYYR